MHITQDIRYVGVNDHKIDLFESQYTVRNGMAYNSYVIIDEKIAVIDSVDRDFGPEWLENIHTVANGRMPDYLIVQHMEPDHSANISTFLAAYPNATIVASAKAFAMMKAYFGTDYAEQRIIVKEGDTLPLGKHTLSFVTAPMVHWPEVIVTYDMTDKVLFSADGFGKFGAIGTDEPWEDEARRYYIGIVGKYGTQVQSLLKKAAALDISIICPLHGPVLKENLSHYTGLYQRWSSYQPEESGVLIAYSSVYGHTREGAVLLAQFLESKGEKVTLYDLSRTEISRAVADAFRFDRVVLATTTYNADIFPCMKSFIHALTERGFRNRTVGLIENGSWAPMAAKIMRTLLEGCKDVTFAEPVVTINAALNDQSRQQIADLADALQK